MLSDLIIRNMYSLYHPNLSSCGDPWCESALSPSLSSEVANAATLWELYDKGLTGGTDPKQKPADASSFVKLQANEMWKWDFFFSFVYNPAPSAEITRNYFPACGFLFANTVHLHLIY